MDVTTSNSNVASTSAQPKASFFSPTNPPESNEPKPGTSADPQTANKENEEEAEEEVGEWATATTKKITPSNDLGGALCIFYTKSPFSDFAPAPFILDGKYYYSVEHFFQIQMLASFGLFKLASQLIKIPDALTFRKTLRTNLKSLVRADLFEEKTFAKWKITNANKMMRKSNQAKFDQNFSLRQLLLHTGERILIFTNKNDKLLGVGMTEAEFLFWIKKNKISIEDLLDILSGTKQRPKEMGCNCLGVALMEIRADMENKQSVLAEWRHTRQSGTTDTTLTAPVTDIERLHLCGFQEDIIAVANKEAADKFSEPPLPPEVAAELASASEITAETPTVEKERKDIVHIIQDDEKNEKEEKKGTEEAKKDEKTNEEQKPTEVEVEKEGKAAEQQEAKKNEETDKGAKTTEEQKANEVEKEGKAEEQYEAKKNEEEKSQEKTAEEKKEETPNEEKNEETQNEEKKKGETAEEEKEETPNEEKKDETKSREETKEDQTEGNKDKATEGKELQPPLPGTSTIHEYHREYHVIRIPEERRIFLQKLNAEKRARVIGEEEEKEEQTKRQKTTRFEPEPPPATPVVIQPEAPPETSADAVQRNQTVLDRLKSLKFQSAMVNPFSVPLAVEQEATDRKMDEEWIEANRPRTPPPRPRPKGAPYTLEPGEIPPPGVVPPPPGVQGPAVLLPLSMRQWIYRPPPAYGRPAGLPHELLPRPPTPPGVDPILYHQRFEAPPSFDENPRGGPLFTKRQRIIPITAAPELPERTNWKPPANPVLKILLKARNFMKNLKEKREQKQLNATDEGATPQSREHSKKVNNDELEIDPVAFDRNIFPFGMEASLGDLFDLGFVPPPIVGNPYAQSRNVKIKKSDWITQFDNIEAALRHAANRWIKGGRLTTTGKFEEFDDLDEETQEAIYKHMIEEEEEEEARPRGHFETQVIYVDTAQYNEYVRWYQKEHGLTPLPSDPEVMKLERQRAWYHHYRTSVTPYKSVDPDYQSEPAPEKLYGNSWGDYFSLARWRWAQWERKVERGDQAELVNLKGETWSDGVRFGGKPMDYSTIKPEEEEDEPMQEGNEVDDTQAEEQNENEKPMDVEQTEKGPDIPLAPLPDIVTVVNID